MNENDDSMITKSKSSTSDISSPDISPNSKKRLSIKDFEIIKLLGKGAFAEVFLAKNKSNKHIAIKTLDKHFMHKVIQNYLAK
jgi:serine/threonine protein kinase